MKNSNDSVVAGFDWSGGNDQKIAFRPWFTRDRVEAAFRQPLLITPCDRPPDEERHRCFATVEEEPVVVVFTMRSGKIRPISARIMSRRNEPSYMEQELPHIPKFQTEAEEADWWNSPAGIKYSEQSLEQALEAGAYVKPRGPVTMEDIAKVQEASRMMQLRPVSIRLPERDIADAKEIAEREGVGYQVILKRAARAGLDAMLTPPRKGIRFLNQPVQKNRRQRV